MAKPVTGTIHLAASGTVTVKLPSNLSHFTWEVDSGAAVPSPASNSPQPEKINVQVIRSGIRIRRSWHAVFTWHVVTPKVVTYTAS